MRNPLRNLVARQVDRPTLRERFDATCERWRRRPTAQVSPELAQAIADAERLNAAIKEPDGFEGDWWPDRGLVRQGVEARAAVVRFPSVGMADTAAKLASVGRIYGAPGIREEVQSSLSNGDATYDDLALTVVAELLEKGGLGAAPIVPLSARPDPIFGLIEEARHLTREHGRLNAISADLPDSHPSWKAENQAHAAMWDHVRGVLLKTVPMTAAGCVALARFACEFTEDQASLSNTRATTPCSP